MMMHDGPSGLLSSCDLRIIGCTEDGDSSMVKQHQTNIYSHSNHHHQQQHQQHPPHHHHHHTPPIHHSESSRSSSISSSSLSPKTSSLTIASSTTTTSATVTSVPGVTAAFSDIDPKLAQDVEYELGLTKKNGGTSGTRKNAWGNLSYAELISKAITSSAEQRLTLSEIYDWMIKYVPFFRNKVDRVSSAGWKNSIRHNLSLHNRFKRVQSEGSGKSSWWMINPDEKLNGNNSSSTSTATTKQPRRRLGQSGKVSSTPATKRLRATPKSTKPSKSPMVQGERDNSTTSQPILTNDIPVAMYDTQTWQNQSDVEMVSNHLYEQDLYSTSVNTPTTNSSINSVGCIPSAYPYDDVPTNYNTNGSSTNTNTNDYGYHHSHHYHHSHPQTLYQPHHSSNYDLNSNNGYYISQQQQQRVVLNDHASNPCPISIDTYHPTANNSYSLGQQTAIDPNDEQSYLRVHSTSSHSSTASLSPPTLSTNNNLVPSSSSGSSSSNYSHSHKSSTSGGYLHPTTNGTLTLYSHHHQPHIAHLSHSHPSEVATFRQLNIHHDDIENDDDEDDLLTLVHHHELLDDRQALPSFYSNAIEQRPQINSHHLIHSNNDGSTSILRTVLHRPIVEIETGDIDFSGKLRTKQVEERVETEDRDPTMSKLFIN